MAKDRIDSRHGQNAQQLELRFELVGTLQPGESALAKIVEFHGSTDSFQPLPSAGDQIRVHATFYRAFGFEGERGWCTFYPDHDVADDGTMQWEVTSLEGSLLRPAVVGDDDIAANAEGEVKLGTGEDEITVTAKNHAQATVKSGDRVTVFYYPHEQKWYIMAGGAGDGVTIVKVTGTTVGESSCTWPGKVQDPNEEATGYCSNQFSDAADCLLVVLNSDNGSAATGAKAKLTVGERYLAKKIGRIGSGEEAKDVYAIRIESSDTLAVVKVTGTTAGETGCTWAGKVQLPDPEATGYCTSPFADGVDCLLVVLNSFNGSVATGSKAQLEIGETYLGKKIGRLGSGDEAQDVYAIRIENTFIIPVTLTGSVSNGGTTTITLPNGDTPTATNKSGQKLEAGNATAYRSQTDLNWYLTGSAKPEDGTTDAWHAVSQEEILASDTGNVLLPDPTIGTAGVVTAKNWSNFARILNNENVFCWRDPTDENFYCISSNYAEPVRFKLTSNLLDTTTSSAFIRDWNGSAWVDGDSITVTDMTERAFKGVAGALGWALRKKDNPDVFEIIWMEPYAPSARFTWDGGSTGTLVESHGETGPDDPVDLVDPDDFFTPNWGGPALGILDHDQNRYNVIQSNSFAGGIHFTLKDETWVDPCKTLAGYFGSRQDIQDPSNGDLAENPVAIHKWGYLDAVEDSRGFAVLDRIAGTYRAVVVDQKSLLMWAEATEDFTGADTTVALTNTSPISPFPFSINTVPESAKNPLKFSGKNGNTVLLSYDAEDGSYFILHSPGAKTSRLFVAFLAAALHSADGTATVSAAFGWALDGGPVPGDIEFATNTLGLSAKITDEVLIAEDWTQLVPETDKPTYKLINAEHYVKEVITSVRTNAGKLQYKKTKITVMHEADEDSAWTDAGDVGDGETEEVTLLVDAQYNPTAHAFQKKTRTVKVHEPGTISAWTTFLELYHTQMVDALDFTEHTLTYHWVDVWLIEEPTESGEETTIGFTQRQFAETISFDGENLSVSLFNAYVVDPTAAEDTIVTGTETLDVVYNVTDDGTQLTQHTITITVWAAGGDDSNKIADIDGCS